MADEQDYIEEQPEDEGVAEAGEYAEDSTAQNEVPETVEAAAEYIEPPAEDAAPAASPKNWYIIHT